MEVVSAPGCKPNWSGLSLAFPRRAGVPGTPNLISPCFFCAAQSSPVKQRRAPCHTSTVKVPLAEWEAFFDTLKSNSGILFSNQGLNNSSNNILEIEQKSIKKIHGCSLKEFNLICALKKVGKHNIDESLITTAEC